MAQTPVVRHVQSAAMNTTTRVAPVALPTTGATAPRYGDWLIAVPGWDWGNQTQYQGQTIGGTSTAWTWKVTGNRLNLTTSSGGVQGQVHTGAWARQITGGTAGAIAPAQTVTSNGTVSNADVVLHVIVIDGSTTDGDPFDGAFGTLNGGTATTTAPSTVEGVDPVETGDLLIAVYASQNTTTISAPAGMTALGTPTASRTYITHALFRQTLTTVDPTGARVAGFNPARSYAAVIFALHGKPDPVAPTVTPMGETTDDFSGTLDRAGKWSGTYDPDPNPDTVTVGGRVRVYAAAGPNYANVETGESRTLFGSSVRFYGVVPAPMSPGSAGTVQTALMVLSSSQPAGTRLAITYKANLGTLVFGNEGAPGGGVYWDPNAVTLTYDPVEHWAWGIRHAGANVVLETSADGLTWIPRYTVPTPAWVNATTPSRFALEAWRDSGATTYAEASAVNIAPAAPTTTVPAGIDALQTRTLDELVAWDGWLGTARGHVGEFGWVTLYGDATGAPEWNALGAKYLAAAEALGLDTTAWASGREWGNGYPLGFHVGAAVGDPLTIATTGSPVLAAVPSRAGRFHGVNLSGWEQGVATNGGGTVRAGAGYVHTLADFQYLAANGVDAVRLPAAWERLQPTLGGALDTGALAALDGMLAAARQTGIRVLIDPLHNYGRYTLANGTVYALGGQLTTAHVTDFWSRFVAWVLADRDRSLPIVGYDLMNEVHDTVGGAAGWETASQAALSAIRAAGDTRLVVVQGYAWASLTGWIDNHPDGWITDPAGNFAYSAHHYWDTRSALGPRSGTYQQSPTGPILTYAIELDAAENPPEPVWPVPLTGGTATFAPDYSQANNELAGYKPDSWQRQNAAGQMNDNTVPYPVPITDAPFGRPGRAMQIRVPDTYRRYEVVPGTTYTDGDYFFAGFGLLIEPDTDLDASVGSAYQIVWQLHHEADTGSPPIGLEVRWGGLRLAGGYGRPDPETGQPAGNLFQYDTEVMPAVPTMRWLAVVLHLGLWSDVTKVGAKAQNYGSGRVDAWVDGVRYLDGFVPRCATNYPGGTGRAFPKHGIYHANENRGATVWFADYREGTSYAAVDPTKAIATYGDVIAEP